MFYSISGKIIKKSKNWVALETSEVAYQIFTNIKEIKKDRVLFYIYENIKEDAHDLYGFLTEDELNIFKSLVSVNGVGPKVALSIMIEMLPNQIVQAIENSNMSVFKSVSGVGNKVAGKIIIELKNKFEDFGQISDESHVLEALISLGYKQSEILNILKKIPPDISDQNDKIKWAIKNIKNLSDD